MTEPGPQRVAAAVPRSATVLHTADVHLSSSALGAQEHCFVKAVDVAIQRGVDAVLIAGDLFDHARVADDLLEWTGDQLNRLERPVVILPGNHDTFHRASVYHRFQVTERCPRAILLDNQDGQLVELPGTDLVVWGRAMVEHEPGFRPLAGVPPQPDGRWGIVLAHGLVVRANTDPRRSSPISLDELDAIDWDYVALGHCHAYEEVRPAPKPVLYAGATAASRDSTPGAVIVEFVPGLGADPQWIELDG